MKINLTVLEIIILLVFCLLTYVWAKYGKRIKKWWEELHKRRRGPQQRRPRSPEACPECAKGIHWLPRQLWPEVIPWSEVKSSRGRKVKFLYSIIRLGTRSVIRTALLSLGLSGPVQTSIVERSYLTLRELIAPLPRRTWSMAYDLYHLRLHIQWGLAYYHLCRAHQSLQVCIRGPSRHRFRTPAMAADLTARRWSVAMRENRRFSPPHACSGRSLVGTFSGCVSFHNSGKSLPRGRRISPAFWC